MRSIFGNGRYANVTATLALITAMGGTSYAAATLASNSVGTSQLKANSITSAKVKNGTLLKADFKAGQIPAGPAGAAGAPGPAGPAGANGATGAAGPLLTVLASGQTLRGYVEVWNQAAAAGDLATTSVSFPFPLASAPVTHYIKFGTANPAGCGGTAAEPAANPGHLCIYEISAPYNTTVRGMGGPGGNDTASRFGFVAWASATAGAASPSNIPFIVYATWAVTAP